MRKSVFEQGQVGPVRMERRSVLEVRRPWWKRWLGIPADENLLGEPVEVPEVRMPVLPRVEVVGPVTPWDEALKRSTARVPGGER